MKKAGIATAVGLFLIALITELSLGLKRTGKDIVRDATKAGKDVHPGKKTTDILKELEKLLGKSLVLIGDHIYIVIGGTLFYLYTRKKEMI